MLQLIEDKVEIADLSLRRAWSSTVALVQYSLLIGYELIISHLLLCDDALQERARNDQAALDHLSQVLWLFKNTEYGLELGGVQLVEKRDQQL